MPPLVKKTAITGWIRLFGLTAICSLLMATTSWAQTLRNDPRDLADLNLEDLMKIEVQAVYGASKFLQKVTEAPSSVTIITADEIQRYGYRTLADLLRSVAGFYVTYDRNYSYVGVRGFGRPGDYNSRILVLIDGHRINDNLYDSGFVATEFGVDVDLIERVEIIRGPSSSLYGTNAFFAVINVITKRAEQVRGLELSAERMSFDTYKGRISYGRQFNKGLDLLLSGSFYDAAGPRQLFFEEFADEATNHGIAQQLDDEQYGSFFANLRVKDVSVQGLFHSRKKGIPTASFGTVFNDPRMRTKDERNYVDVKYARQLGQHWSLSGRVYYDRYFYKGTYVYDYSEDERPFLVATRDYAHGQWWGVEAQASRLVLNKHRITGGFEYRDNFKQAQGVYDSDPFVEHSKIRSRSDIQAFFIQDEFTVGAKLRLNLGVRHDHYDTFGGTTNPRLALIYSPLKKTTFKALYGQAFRAPNVFEMFYQGAGNKANPHLRPEEINMTELVWEQYAGDHLRLSASGYYYTLSNLINQEVDPADGQIFYNNVDRVKAKGVELELETKLPIGLEGRVSYAVQQVRSQVTNDVLTNSPKHLGKLNLSAPLVRNKLLVGFEGQYMSRRRTVQGGEAKSFFISNLNLLAVRLAKRLDVSLGVYNLLNTRYGDPGSEEHRQNVIWQDGRTYRVKLTYRFSRD
ncbi:MAG: TonB-dependent receptor [Acidobacteriota bacterium]|nr:TonB-dependent receptor [Blastocatellia bacterium]MDW8238958.1 TonB-dependent receptor [Acidobacteriota bacterium]